MKPYLTIAVLALAPVRGEAALHYSDFENRAIPADNYGIYINPRSGAASSAAPADFDGGPWINLCFGGTAIGSSPTINLAILAPATGNGDGLIANLAAAGEIGPDLSYTMGANGSENHTGGDPGQFQSGESGYIGFAMPAAGGLNYGWLLVTVNQSGAGTVAAAAWEDTPGLAIQMGAVPEPAVALLVLAASVAFSF